jgi:hypothetical protein
MSIEYIQPTGLGKFGQARQFPRQAHAPVIMQSRFFGDSTQDSNCRSITGGLDGRNKVVPNSSTRLVQVMVGAVEAIALSNACQVSEHLLATEIKHWANEACRRSQGAAACNPAKAREAGTAQ